MKTMTVGKFKSNFSEVIEGVKKGEKYTVSYGKKKKNIGVFMPIDQYRKKKERKLGLLEKDGPVKFAKSFKMTEEEFINL